MNANICNLNFLFCIAAGYQSAPIRKGQNRKSKAARLIALKVCDGNWRQDYIAVGNHVVNLRICRRIEPVQLTFSGDFPVWNTG